MIILLLLTYVNFFTFVRGIQNIECSYFGSTSTISNGEYAFFRSPAFPKTLTRDCFWTFQTYSRNNLWFAMYNGVTGGISFGTYSSPRYNSNNDVLIFSTTRSTTDFLTEQTKNPKWIAFESVVLSYNPILNSCPFAQKSITLDTNMIIPIASDFGPEKIHASYGKNIASFNSDVTPDNPKIYFFDSSSGVFQFNMNNANSTNANFVAFISKMDKTTNANTVTCKNESVSSNYITVYNVNYETGYNASDAS
uniref:CUB-like domain-containing protein n=1 Tax=Panagrolaimus sp. PS1159 TaxID=55785 RepID=A0AC35FNP3_9BILA